MAKIATCPKCAKQLGLPASISATDRAECPECRAIFSLSETVQISLPVARVLDPTEQPMAAASSSSDELKENASDTLASNAAPLKSWEERLKNALALDSSDNSATAASDESEKPASPVETQATEKLPSKSPNFEFELEPTPQVEAEPKPAILDRKLPKPQPRATPAASPKSNTNRASTPPKTLADFVTGELDSAGEVSVSPLADLPKQIEKAEVAVQSVVHGPVRRSALPKIVALATGPVLGGLLGLYGLLWFQGAKADFVGLARVLPASLLPSDFGIEEARVAVLPAEAGSLGAEVDLMAKLQEPPVAMKRDPEVLPAAASEPMSPVISTVRIDAEEFKALVEAAEMALPEFMAGDLSISGTIKRKGQAYMALCRLAEHFDFAQQPGLAPAAQDQARQAVQLYQRIASQANLRQDLARIAGRWWEYDKRPSAGIFLAGKVQEAESTGGGTLCFVKLSEQSSVPGILVWFKNARYQNGDQIGVVGRIITEPSELPPGVSYGQVVHAEHSFSLESSR